MKNLSSKSLLILFIMFCPHITLQGQDADISPSSPEAMAVIRSIQTPVNHYTGVTNVAIPFTTVQSGSVSVPVNLSYQTSGIKVFDISTWVGLGWKLNTGGQITRLTRGRNDDHQFGYLNWIQRLNSTWSENDFNDYVSRGYDGESDLFYFEIPGKAGMFLYDNQKNIRTIPALDVKIEWIREGTEGNGGNYFKLTDSDGAIYTFGSLDREDKSALETTRSIKVEDGNESWETFVTGWNLVSIQPAGGGWPINYYYETGAKYTYNTNNINTALFDCTSTLGQPVITIKEQKAITHKNEITPSYLRSIVWNDREVEFVSSESRTDISKARKLDQVKLKGAGKLLQTYKLTYGYYTGTRLQLYKIDVLSSDGQEQFVSSFDYYGAPSGNHTFRDMDHWGYHNSATNTYVYPTMEFSDFYKWQGANREPDLTGSRAHSIRNIKKAGGSTTEFVYELHDADFGGVNTRFSPMGGIRIKEIINSDGTNRSVVKYEYGDQTASYGSAFPRGEKRYFKREYYRLTNSTSYTGYRVSSSLMNNIYDVTGTAVAYKQVKEILPNGSYIVRKFTSFSSNNDIASETREAGSWALNSRKEFDVPQTTQHYMRGLMTEESYYSADNVLVKQTRYTYEKNDAKKIEINNYLPYVHSEEINGSQKLYKLVGVYKWISQPVYLQKIEEIQGPYNLGKESTFEYDLDYLVPKKIVEKDCENNIVETNIKYCFDYGTFNSSQNSTLYALTTLKNRNKIVPVETVVKKNGKVVSGILNTYKGLLNDKNYSLKLQAPVPEAQFQYSAASNNSFTYDPRYIEECEFEYYDSFTGKPSTVKYSKNRRKAIMYSLDSNPIAEAENVVRDNHMYVRSTSTPYTYFSSLPVNDYLFNNPIAQTVKFEIYNSYNGTDYEKVRVSIYTSSGDLVRVLPDFPMWQVMAYTRYTPWHFYLDAGEYKVKLEGVNSAGTVIPVSSLHCNIKFTYYDYNASAYVSETQILHTSFEDEQGAVVNPFAKTGSKVFYGTYPLNVTALKDGTYELSYWKSTDNCRTWTLHKQTLTKSGAAPRSVNIGGNFYIDEVRVHPVDSRMTTTTYLSGVGKSSETDYNGNTTYWEYDGFGRLSRVLDNDRNVLTEYEYNIKQ